MVSSHYTFEESTMREGRSLVIYFCLNDSYLEIWLSA